MRCSALPVALESYGLTGRASDSGTDSGTVSSANTLDGRACDCSARHVYRLQSEKISISTEQNKNIDVEALKKHRLRCDVLQIEKNRPKRTDLITNPALKHAPIDQIKAKKLAELFKVVS